MSLAERESLRKKSVVGAIAGINEPEQKSAENIIVVPKEKAETRSKRVNLLVKPSVFAKAKKKCKKIDITLNECMNQFLESWIDQ